MIAKATEGTNYKDDTFKDIGWGRNPQVFCAEAYHFFPLPMWDAKKQADYFIDYVPRWLKMTANFHPS